MRHFRSLPVLLCTLLLLGCDAVSRQAAREEVTFAPAIVSDLVIGPFSKLVGTHSGWLVLQPEKENLLLWATDLRVQHLRLLATLSRVPPACEYDPEHRDLHLAQVETDRIWHLRLDLEGRSARHLVVEGLEPLGYTTALVCGNRDQVGLAWIDKTTGYPELRFAYSSDHGQTWSPALIEPRCIQPVRSTIRPSRG